MTTQYTPIDAGRHTGEESTAKGDPTGTDFQEELRLEAERSPVGLLAKAWDAIVSVGAPKDRPNLIALGDDEQAHRIVSTAAIMALTESVERFIKSVPKRVEIAPSARVAFAQTTVGTGSPASTLVGWQPDRLRVKIRNHSAADGNSIFLGTDAGLTTETGFELDGDKEIEIETRAAIYAIAKTAAVRVSMVIEFGEDA
jgi:hypothetical protein